MNKQELYDLCCELLNKYHNSALSDLANYSTNYNKDKKELQKEIDEYKEKLGFVDSVSE